MRKVEKGKFKWGSETHLNRFEQQLVYTISIQARRPDKSRTGKRNDKKFDDRKKYCLDYNRGQCKFKDSHEGSLGGQAVWKLHVCRKCLVEDGVEVKHMEKECVKNK